MKTTIAHKGVPYAVTLGEDNKTLAIRRVGGRRSVTLQVVQPMLDHMLGLPITAEEAIAAIDWSYVTDALAPRVRLITATHGCDDCERSNGRRGRCTCRGAR